jgi:dynein light chain LC8-type
MAAAGAGASAPAAVLPPAVVVHSDLPSELERFCITKAQEALTTQKVEKDQAQHIKKALEGHTGGLWHVVVGSSFGMSVSHENNSLVLFKIGRVHILVFQTFDDASLVRKEGAATHVHRKVERKTDEEDEGDS